MARQCLSGIAGKSRPNLSRSVRLEVEFLEDRVTPATLSAYETSALQIINQLRADPTAFANDLKSLYLGGTYQSPSGYAANDPIWTDLRARINSAESTTSWRSGFNSTGPNTFMSMASALPARAPIVWDTGLQDGAVAHNQWMYVNVYAHSVFTQSQAPTISESQASPIPGITRNFNVNPGDWFNPAGLNSAGENISYAYNMTGATHQAHRNGQISLDGYYQRLVYADVIGFMMEYSSGGSWGHLQNLGGSYNVLGVDTLLYENPVETHQDGVAQSYFSTHRLGLRPGVSYANFLVYQDLNNNNAYDAGEGVSGQLTYNFGATSHTLPLTGYSAVQLPSSGTYTVSASYLGNSLGSQQIVANGTNKTVAFKDTTGARVTASSILGTSASVNGVRLTFSEPINAATFTTGDATLTGPAGSLTIGGIGPVAGSNNTQFDVTFATQTAAGAYQLVVGPDIRDAPGNAMDQNQNSANGEANADQYTTSLTINAPPDTTGARVTASSILGTSAAVNGVRLTFSEPINAATFTAADATLTGPAGSLTIGGIGPVAGSNNTQFDVTFATQTAAGAYQLVVGPDIRDSAGNALDQNQNSANGEGSADQYTTSFTINAPLDTTGARVTASSILGTSSSVNGVRLTFSEPINAATFTTGDATFTGPAGSLTIGGIGPIAGSNNTQFDVTFATQTAAGAYQLVVGPDIRDAAGNAMDQNQNSANGETSTDRYTTSFTINAPPDTAGARVTASSILGTSSSVNGVRLTFSEPINAATFTTGDATFTGPAGSLTIGGIGPVAGSNNTQFDVTFATQSAAGAYQLVVGPDIRDAAGNAMDQNQNGANGETSTDRYTTSFTINAPFDTTGARVTASSILGTSSSVNGVRLTFSEPINAATFTTADATLTGPGGSFTINGVGPVAGSNNTQFDVTFAAQTAAGAYQVVVGPDIRDTAGNALDQNQNSANGEASADQYSAPFTINGAAATTYLYIDFGPSGFWRWSAATGYQQLHGADVDSFSVGNDGFITIDFGSNGLWRWSQSTGYQQLHSANVENVVAGANGFVYVDFGNSGFWRWSQATGYQQLHTANVEGFSAGNNGFVYIDFGGSGLWRWSQAMGYQQLHTANVETVAAGPDGFAYIDFGNSGFWRWSQATGYQQLHTANVEGFSVGYDGFVAIDFGVNGLWRWSQTTGYQQLHTANVENTAAGQDGFLFIDFGAAGLWRWSAVTGYLMLNSINPQQIGA